MALGLWGKVKCGAGRFGSFGRVWLGLCGLITLAGWARGLKYAAGRFQRVSQRVFS